MDFSDITNGDITRITNTLEDACRALDSARSSEGEERDDMLEEAFRLIASVTDGTDE